MKTIIMAGGKGTRISELFPDIPKPLIPIDGVPVLEREIISLREQYHIWEKRLDNTSVMEVSGMYT